MAQLIQGNQIYVQCNSYIPIELRDEAKRLRINMRRAIISGIEVAVNEAKTKEPKSNP